MMKMKLKIVDSVKFLFIVCIVLVLGSTLVYFSSITSYLYPEVIYQGSLLSSNHFLDEIIQSSSVSSYNRLRIYDSPSPPPRPAAAKVIEQDHNVDRLFYGGRGDPSHLGGFTYEKDIAGYSTNVFNYMLGPLGIRSIVDLGCGLGFSSQYFRSQGANILCVEGSRDAIDHSQIPTEFIVEHDFTQGPWWPSDTYDVAWAIEFVEHVSRQYFKNYLPIFHKSALIFMTASTNGGWHHVEVHDKWWWVSRMAAHGFIFNEELTQQLRIFSSKGKSHPNEGNHITFSMMAFINPRVFKLPKHDHLLGGLGCYGGKIENKAGGDPCKDPKDNLPVDYEPLLLCKLKSVDSNSDMEYWDCQKNKNVNSHTRLSIPSIYTEDKLIN